MRLLGLAAVMGLCSFALVARAFYIQVLDRDFYVAQGQARSLRELPIPTSRGMVTDRNGEPLAVSTPVESVWGNPQELLKVPDRLPQLAAAIDVPLDVLTRKLAQKSTKEFVYLKRRINPDEAKRILALGIPGVSSQREYRRFYPQGEAMAHVLGFTNVDDEGQEGLELAFDEWLRGKPGAKRVLRDGRGHIIENVDLVRPAEPGRDLTLTIDRRIQFLAYRELRNAMLSHGAASGSIVVVDVATGEVLAMANLPAFNPNAVGTTDRDAHRNRAVTDVLEPGSTMKPITIAAALTKGIVTPNSPIDLSPGWIKLGRYTIRDHQNYGMQTVTGVITKSSNVGATKISARLDDQYFYDFIRKFGYGSKPGSGFPGESSGVLPSPARWSGSSKATISYGYGLSATPLQIAMAYAALANGGVMNTPTFVKGEHGPRKQVVDPVVAHEVMKMMQTVTEKGGTATQGAILGYHVAGKTGTARMFNGRGGYLQRYIAYFAGVVPVDNPRFATVVVVNDPDPAKGGYFGGLVSAPVFKSVMEGSLRLMDVPPDDIETWLAAQDKAMGKPIASVAAPPAPVEEDIDVPLEATPVTP
ncbi:peptidoglycan D,D-transpeptidase FtsI family protein [Cognatilysobacter segetis]|uniref:peptidoglycan D,D-transpeptidase FtsI family protein n=1 Tax=Cognatilysobacter segetis TaxID=2492394 RepID=UPI001EE4766C|nr:penicillin-binding protein 2 [Lysobacter segetis]